LIDGLKDGGVTLVAGTLWAATRGPETSGAVATGPVMIGEAVTGTASFATRLAPHIPQKRLASEFSFPHRPQRTYPPWPIL
jgi:hypothetical protein